MTWFLTCLAILLVVYLSIVALLVGQQRRLIFRPMAGERDPIDAGTPWLTPVQADGRVLGWYLPPPTGAAPTVVFFHGNRGTLGRVGRKTASWRDLGIGLFAATYRGYEGNPGTPSEAGLYEDGRAVLAWLGRAGIPAERIILYGESLGTGIAVQLADETPGIRALVLEAPFTSLPDVAIGRYPWIPFRRLIRHRFDSLAKIGRIGCPVLIIHGARDRTIPVAHARRLHGAAPWARYEEIPGAGHLDLHDRGAAPAVLAFIRTATKPPAVAEGQLPSPGSSPIMPDR